LLRNRLKLLHELVSQGNTVVVIEHNLEVIKTADWVIDLGPEGRDGGGEIVAWGPPGDIVKAPRSYTGKFLAPVLKRVGWVERSETHHLRKWWVALYPPYISAAMIAWSA